MVVDGKFNNLLCEVGLYGSPDAQDAKDEEDFVGNVEEGGWREETKCKVE